MSRELVLKRLSVAEMQPCPVMNIWALSELNELPFAPGDTVNECWVHLYVAAYLLRVRLKTLQNKKVSELVRRHPYDQRLLLYGDIHREMAADIQNRDKE